MRPASAWFGGEFVGGGVPLPIEDPGWASGCGVFETALAVDGRLPLWPLHRERFADGAAQMGLAPELPADLEAIVGELLRRDGVRDVDVRAAVRVTSFSGSKVAITWRPVPPVAARRLVVLDQWSRLGVDPTRAIKTTSRAFYGAAARQAAAEGADDAVLCGDVIADGRVDSQSRAVLETTIGAILIESDRGFCTPRPNGQFIPSVGIAALRRRMVIEDAELTDFDLRTADAIWRVNAVRGPEPAVVDGGPPAPDPERLQAVWRAVLAAATNG